MRPSRDRSVGGAADPIARFRQWFEAAVRRGGRIPERMALATADSQGRPSVRYVLLRGVDERGFVFYTDGRSRKGRELRENPRAALVFYWDALGRQVCVEGRAEPLEPDLVDAYWASRSRDKRLAAASSIQGAPLRSRRDLLQRYERLRERYRGREIPRPPAWTGFRVVPEAIEFWVRGAHRLHHRERFELRDGRWHRQLLQP
jgi:pyridoxamine 5'-phosphate oxidase